MKKRNKRKPWKMIIFKGDLRHYKERKTGKIK